MISPDIPADMKKCGGPCGLVLELDAFNKHPQCVKGRQPRCKKCTNLLAKAKRDAAVIARDAAPPQGRLEIPPFGSHPLHEAHNDTPCDTPFHVTGPGRAVSIKPNPYISDEELLIGGKGAEFERRAALAALLARQAAKPPGMAKAAAPAPGEEIAIRLELATSILDRIANGSRERLPQACAQAAQFVMIERGALRYIRKPKEL